MRLFLVLAALVSAAFCGCPAGWEDRGDYCFHVSSGKETFEQARDRCLAMGGHMAQIDNFVKKTIYDTFGSIMNNFMLGMHFSPFGGWRWLDGRPLVYQNWIPGLDLDDTMDRCAVVLPSGEWSTVSCRDKLRFICEQVKPMDGTVVSVQSDFADDDDDDADDNVVDDDVDGKKPLATDDTATAGSEVRDGDKQYYRPLYRLQYQQPTYRQQYYRPTYQQYRTVQQPQYLITSTGRRVLNTPLTPARLLSQPASTVPLRDAESVPSPDVSVVPPPPPTPPPVATPLPYTYPSYYYPYFPFSFPYSFPSFPSWSWDPFGISNYVNSLTNSIGNQVNAIGNQVNTLASQGGTTTVSNSPGSATAFQSTSSTGSGFTGSGSSVSLTTGPDGKPLAKKYTWTYP